MDKKKIVGIIISIPYIIGLCIIIPIIIILYPIIFIFNLWEAMNNYYEYGYWKMEWF